MSEVLYRKYRPKSFADVIGQDEIVSVLKKSIADKSFGHAYLFSGGRGTGKTTVARIFASEIGTSATDLFEIDAASNRGIDDVRELREAVRTAPFESKYKVYIVDEVHMLTKEAFNALLKTLEEPPEHAVFILATTEKEKLPDTVISRCQTFAFRQPSLDELKRFVIDVAKKESVKLDGPAAEIVAMFGDGSFRDSLSVLEKILISAEGRSVGQEEAAKIVGAPKNSLVNQVLESIALGTSELGLRAVNAAEKEHIDMKIYLKLILQKMRGVLLIRYAPSMVETLEDEFTPDDLALLRTYAEDKDKRINSRVLSIFLEAGDMLGYSAIPSLPIELAIIKSFGAEK